MAGGHESRSSSPLKKLNICTGKPAIAAFAPHMQLHLNYCTIHFPVFWLLSMCWKYCSVVRVRPFSLVQMGRCRV